ncbi:MAG TPA: TauD/TfdA family dioxygenase [Candidatus Binatia bacterium]|nr:TauD/TfdA family dioxygenase [Candidatus Binatia bacterium]
MFKSLRAQTLHYFARPHDSLPREPVKSPAAWRGEDLRGRTDWIVTLSEADVAEIESALRASGDRPMQQLARADFPLPTLGPRIEAWRDEVHRGRGFVLVRGVPVAKWTVAQSERFFWCFGHWLGTPGAQNPEGDLLGHVRDQKTGQDVRYYRTNKQLEVHTDTADIVGLLCLQKAKAGGLSRIVSSVAVFNELLKRRPDLAPRLFAPMWFDTKGEGGVRAFALPPCRHSGGELRTFWQSDYYRTVQRFEHVPRLSPAEQELLDVYDGIANSPEFHLDMDLEPGDVQLLSNHTQLHARTAFEDWPEPARRRHLLRLWISVPQRASLKQRWLRARSGVSLTLAAAAELLKEKRRGHAAARS